MPVGYKLFTALLIVIGIVPLSKNKICFHLKTWTPNLFWFGLLLAKFAIRVHDRLLIDFDRYVRENWNMREINDSYSTNVTMEIEYNDDEQGDSSYYQNRPRTSAVKSVTVIFFFLFEDFVYRTIILVIRFRRRFILQDLKNKISDIEDNLTTRPRFNRHMIRSGCWFLVLNLVVLLADITVDVLDVKTNVYYPYYYSKGIALLLIVNITLSTVETITNFAVEGMLIYYCVFFQYVMREYNKHLTETFETWRELKVSSSKIEKCLQEKRIWLISLHSTFEEGSNSMSPLLATSLLDSLLTITFGLFFVGKTRTIRAFTEVSSEFFTRALLRIFLSLLRILIMCNVSEYPNTEANKTYRLLSGVKLPRSTDNSVKEEMILLHLTKNSVSFRFTVGGFCDLKKSLLPTIAGAVITYTVILCQD